VTKTPHDALFKSVFQQPENAAAELQHVLSAEHVSAIDWSTCHSSRVALFATRSAYAEGRPVSRRGSPSATLLLLLLLLLLLSVLGCGRAWPHTDTWYTGAPQGHSSGLSSTPLADERVHEVPAPAQSAAQAQLADEAFVPVGPDELRAWGLRPGAGGEYMYLVRAVKLNDGKFTAATKGGALHIHHRCVGARPVHMTRVEPWSSAPIIPSRRSASRARWSGEPSG